jgi:hypothetical protein
MQDNEPLMRALAKVSLCTSRSPNFQPRHLSTYPNLVPSPHSRSIHTISRITLDLRSRDTTANIQLVTVNNPDKILFVGEALVGNEAVDQLTKFDRALKDFSSAGIGGGSRKRGIDGIILTKFDTIVSVFDSLGSCGESEINAPYRRKREKDRSREKNGTDA